MIRRNEWGWSIATVIGGFFVGQSLIVAPIHEYGHLIEGGGHMIDWNHVQPDVNNWHVAIGGYLFCINFFAILALVAFILSLEGLKHRRWPAPLAIGFWGVVTGHLFLAEGPNIVDFTTYAAQVGYSHEQIMFLFNERAIPMYVLGCFILLCYVVSSAKKCKLQADLSRAKEKPAEAGS